MQIGLPASIVQVKSSSLGTNEQKSGYYIKPSLNLYNLFVSEMGRAPFNNEPITFYIDTNVAIVSRNTNTPAISMGTGWSSQKINIINRGLILGAGGPGGDIGGAKGPNGVGGDGGTAIHGSSALIHIMNDGGTIAGGGGGGVSDMYDNEGVGGSYGGGGGGAPFGIGGLSGGGDRGNSASLLTGGAAMFGGTAGGNIGLPGATQTITYDRVPVAGGKAGYVLQGNDRSIITNTNNGKLIGR